MKKLKINKKFKAFSVTEIIIVLALISLVIYSLATFSIAALRLSEDRWKSNIASIKMHDMSQILVDKKNSLWESMLIDSGDKHLAYSGSTYSIVDGSENLDGISYSFKVQSALRDTNGNFVTSGGTTDLNSKLIQISSEWVDKFGFDNLISSQFYITNWNSNTWTQTSTSDFNQGTNDNTIVTSNGGGSVQLQTIIYPDWCNPSLQLNQYDLPGNSVSKTIFANTGHAYLGTAGTNTTTAMTKLNISGVTPPTISVEGTFGGYAVNDIFIVGNVAYLATTDNSKEVVILDISQYPYQQIGYFNASGTTDADSVYVSGTVGYVATGEIVQSFNLTSNTGSRAKYGEITMARDPVFFFGSDYVSQIVVRGNYLFAALNNDWYELSIANVSNPSNMSFLSKSSVNNLQTSDVYVSPDGNRAYFGTNYGSSENEFFIMNTSNKNSPSIIGSYNTHGMSITGIAIVTQDNRAVLVGKNGQEYQAVDISNEHSPTFCGGMDINNGIEDIDTVSDAQGNAFAYLVTDDSSSEFKILRGGPGGGNGSGEGYALSGTYTSTIFDSTSSTSKYYTIDFNGTIPVNTNMNVQVRSSSNSDMSSSTNWVGPDGTSSTSFAISDGDYIPSLVYNKRYFQYKINFSSNQLSTAELEDLTLTYQK